MRRSQTLGENLLHLGDNGSNFIIGQPGEKGLNRAATGRGPEVATAGAVCAAGSPSAAC